MTHPPLLPHQKNNRVALLLFVASCAAFFAAGRFLSVRLPDCIFHHLTGLPCLFCGGTRALSALLQGHWERAFYLNPIAFFAFAGAGLLCIVFTLELARNRLLIPWASASFQKWTPLLLLLLGGWWALHILTTLRTPKRELLDLRNPIARAAYERIHGTPR